MRVPGLLLLCCLTCNALPIYYLATGQTGAQTQIDVAHTSTWTLTPNISFDFGGGLITMKSGQSTNANVTLSLYQGSNSSGTLLRSTVLTNATFCAQVGNCSSYAFHAFSFGPAVSLLQNTTYFVSLTSPAVDTQSLAYFIKNDVYFISDAAGVEVVPSPAAFNVIVTPPPPPPPPTGVPEPQTLVMMATGIALMYTASRTRSKTAKKKEK